MNTKMIYAIVAVLAVIAFVAIRYSIRGAIFDRLPIAADEQVLVDESSLRVFQRVRGPASGGSTMFGMRVVVTNRRILMATGGPEGKHKFMMRYVVEHHGRRSMTAAEISAATAVGFELQNGYPTYRIGLENVRIVEDGAKQLVEIQVPYTVDTTFQVPPVIKIHTDQAEKYRQALGLAGPA